MKTYTTGAAQFRTGDTDESVSHQADYVWNLQHNDDLIEALQAVDIAEAIARNQGDVSTLAAAQAYIDALIRGPAIKAPVLTAVTTNVSLTAPGNTFDTLTYSNVGTDDVLLTAQTDGTQNGIYVWNGPTSPLVRRSDADSTAEMKPGLLVLVTNGSSANRDKLWELQTDAPIVLGTTALTFALASGSVTGIVSANALGTANNPVTDSAAAPVRPDKGVLDVRNATRQLAVWRRMDQ